MQAELGGAEVWFAIADRDLRACELALSDSEPLADIACYHAQQCAEKCLKGYLVSRDVAFRFVHELAYLVRIAMRDDVAFADLLDPASSLQDYASDVRYPPDEFGPPSVEDARQAVSHARFIRSFVLARAGKAAPSEVPEPPEAAS
jgi:HEPN domain-containing protein